MAKIENTIKFLCPQILIKSKTLGGFSILFPNSGSLGGFGNKIGNNN